jgi:hypothetical protein
MSEFPSRVETRADAMRFLGSVDGRNNLELGAWDIDDFSSIPHRDAVIEKCRLRVLFELIPLLSSLDENEREGITPLVSELIAELEAEGVE